MAAMVRRRLSWFIVFLQSASMVVDFCVTNVMIPTLRRAVKLKWENSHFVQPVARTKNSKSKILLWLNNVSNPTR